MERTATEIPEKLFLQKPPSLRDHRHPALRAEVLGERVPAAASGKNRSGQRVYNRADIDLIFRIKSSCTTTNTPSPAHARRSTRTDRPSSTRSPRNHAPAAPSSSRNPPCRRGPPSPRPPRHHVALRRVASESPEAPPSAAAEAEPATAPSTRGARHADQRQRGSGRTDGHLDRRARAQPPVSPQRLEAALEP